MHNKLRTVLFGALLASVLMLTMSLASSTSNAVFAKSTNAHVVTVPQQRRPDQQDQRGQRPTRDDYTRGFRAGYSDGYYDGYRDCGRQQFSRRAQPQVTTPTDYERGYSDGYSRGYQAGVNSCESSSSR